MSLKNIKTISWKITEANEQVEQELDEKYWDFLINRINYKEISFDAKKKEIVFAAFIPVRDIIIETLEEIEKGYIDVLQCRVCEGYFDINKNEGIFGDPQKLKHFICDKCSRNISAKDFYDKHLAL